MGYLYLFGGIRAPPNTWICFFTPYTTSGISIGSAVLVQLTLMTSRHTDHAKSVTIGRTYTLRLRVCDVA